MSAPILTNSRPQASNRYFASPKLRASAVEKQVDKYNEDLFISSKPDSGHGINWSQGARVAAKVAAFAAPAALGAAGGDGTLAFGGMLGSMGGAMFMMGNSSNHDGEIMLQGLVSVVGTAIAAAAGGFGGYTGAAVAIGGFAALGGVMAALTPSGDPNLPYAR